MKPARIFSAIGIAAGVMTFAACLADMEVAQSVAGIICLGSLAASDRLSRTTCGERE